MIKKFILAILFTLVLSGGASAKTSLENFSINEDNKIYSKRNVNYFTNQGYEIVLQETRGTTTGYVLKKMRFMWVAEQWVYLKSKPAILLI